MKKSTITIIITITIIAVFLIINLLVILEETGNLDEISKNLNIKGQEDGFDEKAHPEDVTPDENFFTNIFGGSQSAGGSSSSSSSMSSSTTECRIEQTSYSIEDIISSFDCLEENNSICTKKELNCSVEVNNLDGETSGTYDINFIFYEKGTLSNNSITNIIQSVYVTKGSKKRTQVSTILESFGEEGNANKDLLCTYETLSVPTKEICTN